MPTMNGITITGSEYRELRRLAQIVEAGGNPSDHVLPSMQGQYLNLHGKGLVSGVLVGTWGTEFRLTGLTRAGMSFIEDLEEADSRALSLIRSDRRFQVVVALIGAVSGALAGLVVSLIT